MDGKRILVVGASSGVGAAVARLADAQGARVAISARRADTLGKMMTASRSMVAVPGDVRDEASARSIVDAAVEALGALDAVVYTVGVSPLQSLAGATAAQWRDVLDTNLVGAAIISAASAPHLLETDGRLLLLSSKSVRRPFPDLTLYATSKFALDGLIRCLPGEFPGLRVTRVVVGNTEGTDFTASWDPEALGAALVRWEAAGVLSDGAMSTMRPEHVAASICHVITSPAHIDEIAVVDHASS
ncbi:MAG: SDR family oxidoreductase [Acidimicrobiales bacterium]